MRITTRQLNRRQPILWIGAAFFGGIAVYAWLDAQAAAALIFAVFCLGCALLLIPSAQIVLDEAGISYRSWLGEHYLSWEEVRSAQTDGVTVVLRGEAKKFPVAPFFWEVETRSAARACLDAQLAYRNIVPEFSPACSEALFRNTRVRRGSSPQQA